MCQLPICRLRILVAFGCLSLTGTMSNAGIFATIDGKDHLVLRIRSERPFNVANYLCPTEADGRDP